MNKKRQKTINDAQAAPIVSESPLTYQMSRMKSSGYSVFPATIFEGEADLVSQLGDVMNFSGLSTRKRVTSNPIGTDTDNFGRTCGTMPSMVPGGFMSSGTEVGIDYCGSPDRGYIAWGANNQLPNFIALANSMLVYTSTAIKFNVDVANGLGIKPIYKYYSNAGGTTKEEEIGYAAAGSMIRARITQLQQKILSLTSQYIGASVSDITDDDTSSESSSENVSHSVSDVSIVTSPPVSSSSDEEQRPDNYFKSIVEDTLDDIVKSLTEEINLLKKDYGIWEETNKALNAFQKRTNLNMVNHKLFTDLITYGTCFPEFQLSQDGNRPKSGSWKPQIVGIGCYNALCSRLEKHDKQGVSRHVYISNSWLNPQERMSEDCCNKIDALPAIDPLHPNDDLTRTIRNFRREAQRIEDEEGVSIPYQFRPTRHIMPVSYSTAGRVYYGVPSYWAIYNDIYQYAMTIVRDRAIRKQNENMFGRIIYVHSEYLERLVNQINATKTDEEKQKIRSAEISKIKQFLSNKLNNGQTFAACTFIGSDGKDHDAFKIETVSYNDKNAAEADKTEISDISGIILFAMECHPDLIGSTPGGASKSGGTYQREMLQIKQSKMAPTQNLVLSCYDLIRDFNGWDTHLAWKIEQKTLTTLDRSRSGVMRE